MVVLDPAKREDDAMWAGQGSELEGLGSSRNGRGWVWCPTKSASGVRSQLDRCLAKSRCSLQRAISVWLTAQMTKKCGCVMLFMSEIEGFLENS